MSIKDDIQRERERAIANYAKPQAKPPGPTTVTGFDDGLVQTTSSEGAQARKQQGGRALWEGKVLPAHDRSAVFTGRAREFEYEPEPFIAVNSRPLPGNYSLWGYTEFFSAADNNWFHGPQFGSIYETAMMGRGSRTDRPRRNNKMILNFEDKYERILEWEQHRAQQEADNDTPTPAGLNNKITYVGLPLIFYESRIVRVAWVVTNYEETPIENGIRTETFRHRFYESRFTIKLKPLGFSQVGSFTYTKQQGTGLNGIVGTYAGRYYYSPAEETKRFIPGTSILASARGNLLTSETRPNLTQLSASSVYFPNNSSPVEDQPEIPIFFVEAKIYSDVQPKSSPVNSTGGEFGLAYDYSPISSGFTITRSAEPFIPLTDHQALIDATGLTLSGTGEGRASFRLVDLLILDFEDPAF